MANSTPRPTFFTSFLSAFRAGQKFAPLQSKSQPASVATSASTTVASQSMSITTRVSPSAWDGSASSTGGPAIRDSSFSPSSSPSAGAASQMLPARQASPGPTSPRSIPFARPPSPQIHESLSSFNRQQRSRTPSETRMSAAGRRSIELPDAGQAGGSTGLASATSGFKSGFARGEDPLSAQNWYVGGRTATGEERFYKLGMVRRYNSQDRLSLDRLSI